MQYTCLIIFLIFIGCNSANNTLKCDEILDNSILKHDPKSNWKNTEFKVRIQEPRIQNPERYSLIALNNKTGAFELKRNRENSISTHIIDSLGNPKTLLNNTISNDSLLISKYRLEPERNFGYRRFYQLLLGLPMSLKDEEFVLNDRFEEVIFNKTKAYKISLELKEPLFSKNWNLFFSKNNFKMIGLEMVFPDDKTRGERLVFEGEILINDVLLSRTKHWYQLDNSYSGSDIILNELK